MNKGCLNELRRKENVLQAIHQSCGSQQTQSRIHLDPALGPLYTHLQHTITRNEKTGDYKNVTVIISQWMNISVSNHLIQRCVQNKPDLQQSVWRVSCMRCRDLHPPSSASSSSFESTPKAEERYSQAALDSMAGLGLTVLSECGLHTVSQPPDQQPSGLKQQWIWSGPKLKEQHFTI